MGYGVRMSSTAPPISSTHDPLNLHDKQYTLRCKPARLTCDTLYVVNLYVEPAIYSTL